MNIKRTNKEELIRTHIDIISSLHVKESKWLRPREKEFLIHSIIVRQEGLALKSNEAVKELKQRMGFSTMDDVYNYRRKLKNKQWLIQTKDDIVLPVAFDMFKKEINTVINYKFDVSWEN